MSTKPTDAAQWSTSGPITVPGAPKKAGGFAPKEKGAAQYFNYLHNVAGQWHQWLLDGNCYFGNLSCANLVTTALTVDTVTARQVTITPVAANLVPALVVNGPLGVAEVIDQFGLRTSYGRHVFDDFNRGALDTSLWTAAPNGGTVALGAATGIGIPVQDCVEILGQSGGGTNYATLKSNANCVFEPSRYGVGMRFRVAQNGAAFYLGGFGTESGGTLTQAICLQSPDQGGGTPSTWFINVNGTPHALTGGAAVGVPSIYCAFFLSGTTLTYMLGSSTPDNSSGDGAYGTITVPAVSAGAYEILLASAVNLGGSSATYFDCVEVWGAGR